VVLSEPVNIAHALYPTNDSERLVFRKLFQGLIWIDCRGRIHPGLARAWEPDSSRRTWTFQLQEDRPQLGTPGAAEDVVSSWRAHPEVMTAGGIESAEVLRDGRLSVRFRSSQDSVPRILADPMLAVAHGGGSILGRSDRFLIPESTRAATEFRVEPGTDPRDALDQDGDLVVTRDPSVAEYVSGRQEFLTSPLPWSRTYVLLQPAGAEPIKGVFGVDSVAGSLARDVARTEARPAQPPFWWRGPQACLLELSLAIAPPKANRIVYQLSDEVARNIAERIVALGVGTRLRATGLSEAEFTLAFEKQADIGYITSLPRDVVAPCYQSQALPHGAWIQPLIDTRARAIYRRGGPPLTVDWDGTIRVLER
jgi:hypothetical protein